MKYLKKIYQPLLTRYRHWILRNRLGTACLKNLLSTEVTYFSIVLTGRSTPQERRNAVGEAILDLIINEYSRHAIVLNGKELRFWYKLIKEFTGRLLEINQLRLAGTGLGMIYVYSIEPKTRFSSLVYVMGDHVAESIKGYEEERFDITDNLFTLSNLYGNLGRPAVTLANKHRVIVQFTLKNNDELPFYGGPRVSVSPDYSN